MGRFSFRAFGGATLLFSLGALFSACFVEPRPEEEIFAGIPILSNDPCTFEQPDTCHDGNPCTRDVCSDWGLCYYEPDDSLIPSDGQDCTVDTCDGGIARHEPASARAPCGANGALTCDGSGTCTGCGADAALCGEPTPCLAWGCDGGSCVPSPTPAGDPLPAAAQVPGDCGIIYCDGRGGTLSLRGDDPVRSFDNPCREFDCFTGSTRLRPLGAPCNEGCGPGQAGLGAYLVGQCDATGACLPAVEIGCGLGYACGEGACYTECTPETESMKCVYGATCEDGKCHIPWAPESYCQASCERFDELGCPLDPSGLSCEASCLTLIHEASNKCFEAALMYVTCLGEVAAKADTCAAHRTSCATEYELYRECEGEDVPDDAGCTLLPCMTGFNGCSCAAFCNDVMVADHCAPTESGSLACVCAKDGVTVASCETAAGCGIEKGCCSSVL